MSAHRKPEFKDFFRSATRFDPYPWQEQIANRGLPEVLSVPTGLGKTEGSAVAWAYRLFHGEDPAEPRHLVYCLPMRALVQQTRARLLECFKNLREHDALDVGVHVLMGGDADEKWVNKPECPWVLIGTQDMLLSRALNRGYGAIRYEWPIHFGLLNNDCRWIIDEVQLMGAGLSTTAQLDWMRRCRFHPVLPCSTTWMSATLGLEFLATADRKRDGLDKPQPVVMSWDVPSDASATLRKRMEELRDARRPVEVFEIPTQARNIDAKERKLLSADPILWPRCLTERVRNEHRPGTLSLVVCNTVEKAREVFEALGEDELKLLLTSRFRGADRRDNEARLLNFESRRKVAGGSSVPDHPGLICVSTQVVEAGLDISAHRLWSEIAPWPSVVQRLGRLNRDGLDQAAKAIFWSNQKLPEMARMNERFGPYLVGDLITAYGLLKVLAAGGVAESASKALEALRNKKVKEIEGALASKPTPLPRAVDVHGLFSTEPDLFGGFTDVSGFVRDSDPDADVTIFWRTWLGKTTPSDDKLSGPPFSPEEGVAIPYGQLQKFFERSKSRFWIWNDDDGRWESVRPSDVRPGMRLMLPGAAGGYTSARGWTGNPVDQLDDLPPPGRGRTLRDDVRTEMGYWASLTCHLSDARVEAESLCKKLGLNGGLAASVIHAAASHDLGKALPAWQQSLPTRDAEPDMLLAKSPQGFAVEVEHAWATTVVGQVSALVTPAAALSNENTKSGKGVRLRWAVGTIPAPAVRDQIRKLRGVKWAGKIAFRPSLRHEAASALAMWHRYASSGKKPYPALAVYLGACHHGKVRTVLRATLPARNDVFGVLPSSAPLEVAGDLWPMDFSIAADGASGDWSDDGTAFVIRGPGWTEIVADLLGSWEAKTDNSMETSGPFVNYSAVPEDEPRALGPFALAYLEALVRIADRRASERPSSARKLNAELADE